MHVFHSLNEWISFRHTLAYESTLGFAPTMGNLHAGHASLFLTSKKENDYTASSLFVNPTQFNQKEDFTHYPRTLAADLQLMEDAGVDFCIIPDENAIYPDHYNYKIHEKNLCQLMEGAHRPGHFDGVLTVVMKLLNLVRPHKAYFGEKDYQQYVLIREMVEAFFMNIEIIPCPIIREHSGLAYSSRNNRLTPEQKNLAENFAQLFHQRNKECQQIQQELENANIEVEYIQKYENRRYIAIRIGGIRLIDNYLL